MSYYGFLPNLLLWWYREGLKSALSFFKNLIVYFFYLFSIPTIGKTFFAPWKKMVAAKRPGIDGLKDWLADNFVSRGVGVVMRSGLLITFSALSLALIATTLFVLAFWVLMPLVVVLSIINIFRS